MSVRRGTRVRRSTRKRRSSPSVTALVALLGGVVAAWVYTTFWKTP